MLENSPVEPVQERGRYSKWSSRSVSIAMEHILEDPHIRPRNKEIISDFVNKCYADDLSALRIIKLLGQLKILASWLGKDLDKATREDIEGLVGRLNQSSYQEWTKYSYKVVIKKLYKVLEGKNDFYPDKVKWIKPQIKRKNRKTPEGLLTQEEVLQMLKVAPEVYWRALISVLYEGGLRIMELLTMKNNSVVFDEFGCRITVFGKTGKRTLRLVSSASHLSNWINHHPTPLGEDAWLWPNPLSHERRLDPQRLNRWLKEIAVKAGIEKRVHAHLFRHSRATHLAKVFTEQELKKYFGWAGDSRMAAIYVHLSDRDLDDKIMQMHGLKLDDKMVVNDGVLEPVPCPRCGLSNPGGSDFCSRCGLPLSIKVAMKKADEQNDKIIMVRAALGLYVQKHPEIMDALIGFVEEHGKEVTEAVEKEKGKNSSDYAFANDSKVDE